MFIIYIFLRKYLTTTNIFAQHEAGHFLTGYLLGVLPKGYEIPSAEALKQDDFAVGRVQFVGFDFLKEVSVMLPFAKFYSMVVLSMVNYFLKNPIYLMPVVRSILNANVLMACQ